MNRSTPASCSKRFNIAGETTWRGEKNERRPLNVFGELFPIIWNMKTFPTWKLLRLDFGLSLTVLHSLSIKNVFTAKTFARKTRLAKVSCGGWLNWCRAWIFTVLLALRQYDGWQNKFEFLKNSLFKVLWFSCFSSRRVHP